VTPIVFVRDAKRLHSSKYVGGVSGAGGQARIYETLEYGQFDLAGHPHLPDDGLVSPVSRRIR